MIFAQFYQKSAIGNNLIEATGDRSVVILDGRLLESANSYIAREECRKRGFLAFRLYCGDSFNRSVRAIGPFIEL